MPETKLLKVTNDDFKVGKCEYNVSLTPSAGVEKQIPVQVPYGTGTITFRKG